MKIMKRVLLLLLLATSSLSFSQKNFNLTVGSEFLNFTQKNYIVDSNYKLNDKSYLSSWSSYATGRGVEIGGNYFVSQNLINFKYKKSTLSSGYQFLNLGLQNIKRHSFVVRVNYKLF